jgi:hypothetical protein
VKQVQVEAVDLRQADTNEAVGQIANAFETDNLPVKGAAIASRRAPHHNHQRLAALLRTLLALTKTEEPAVFRRGDLIAATSPALGEQGRIRQSQRGDGQAGHCQELHGQLSQPVWESSLRL